MISKWVLDIYIDSCILLGELRVVAKYGHDLLLTAKIIFYETATVLRPAQW